MRPAPDDPDQPEAAGRRLAALDVVRGAAVLGILVPNIIGMGQPLVGYAWPAGFLAPPGPLSDWLWGMQLVFVDGKFRGLFTLLFGAGMMLFLRSAERRGDGAGLLARRLCWLALFGLLHWALLWRGDILLTYAVAGLIALPFLSWPAHKQFALGLSGYLVGAAIVLALASALPLLDPSGWDAIAAEDRAEGELEVRIMATGSYAAWVAHTAGHLEDLVASVLWALFETLPLMLIGMSLTQAGLFDRQADPRRQRCWGLALWLAGTAVTALIAASAIRGGISYADSFTASAWVTFPALASSLGLMALLSLWGGEASGGLARRLADAGRCAFTNYIGCSALGLVVFSGWGLGLFGQLARIELYGVMLAFWAIMLAWSGWWLARFRHGPLEWLWRCLTYGRRMPMRR